ncbi:telomere-protecting terminal protein Tpg [Streptomyces coelicoflavus]|uniref:telomere-protecting terminal protein Tpg n=1 Tax=Streptomyces coelicoflavus TaxID=285562 RepID=UPI00369721A4
MQRPHTDSRPQLPALPLRVPAHPPTPTSDRSGSASAAQAACARPRCQVSCTNANGSAVLSRAQSETISKSAGAQMRYLVKQFKGTRAVAQQLGVSQRTMERYVKDQIRRLRADLAQRLGDAVRQRWQPRVRAQAPQAGGHQHGRRRRHPRPLRLHRRARHHRRRPHPPPHPRPAPHHAARLFDAQDAGASEQQLRDLAAEALGEVYFPDGGRRAAGLEDELTDIEHLQFDL